MRKCVPIEHDRFGVYAGEMPALPGGIFLSVTRAESLGNFKVSIAGSVASLEEQGDRISHRSSYEEVVQVVLP